MKTQDFELKYGTKITFDNGVIQGIGEIVGINHEPEMVIGRGYIVKIIECTPPVPNKEYPYDTTIIFEVHIKEIILIPQTEK